MMWLRTIGGTYVNVAMIEMFSVAQQQGTDRWAVIGTTGVPDGEDPFTVYDFYGPYDTHAEAQVMLVTLMERIHETLHGRPSWWRLRLRRWKAVIGNRWRRAEGAP